MIINESKKINELNKTNDRPGFTWRGYHYSYNSAADNYQCDDPHPFDQIFGDKPSKLWNAVPKDAKWDKINESRKIEFEDDLVIVRQNGKEIYKGIEDYEPMKDEPWKWDGSKYTLPGGYTKEVV